jgi:hypothetical protein
LLLRPGVAYRLAPLWVALMEEGLVRRQPGPSPSKSHFHKRTLKADRQSLFRIGRKALRTPIGRPLVFYRESANK